MNIAFDAGAIEIAKGSGVGNYTLNQFKALIHSEQDNNYYYFNTICKSDLIKPLKGDNFFEINYYMGKNNVLREYDSEYQELFGQLVTNFLHRYSIDVFYITSPFLSENVLYKKEWFEGVTVVATAYDIIPYIMKEKYLQSKYLQKWYMSCIEMLRWCDCQLAISQSVKDDMVKYLNFNPDKIDIIYGGVSDKYCIKEYAREEDARLFSKFKIKSKFIMCGVSADQRKNVAGAISAYGLLQQEIKKNYQLVIVGKILPEALKQYQVQIDKLGEIGNIILTNYVTDEELIQLYNKAELMLFPSLYEGFGLPLIESWACGTPVAASNNSSLGELARGAGILFDPSNIKDIARAIEEALTTADLDALLEIGRKKLAAFTWENVAGLTLEFIKKTISKQEVKEYNKQQKIVCVFWNSILYCEGWSLFFEQLGSCANITLVSSEDDSDILALPNSISINEFERTYMKYEAIYHFTEGMVSKAKIQKMKSYHGIGIFLSEDILYKISLWNKGVTSSVDIKGIWNAQRVRRYFDKSYVTYNLMDYITIFDKILVFNNQKKQEIMKKSLEIDVYNITPNLENLNENDTIQQECKIIVYNLLKAGEIKKMCPTVKEWADRLIKKEITEKNYSINEIRDLAHTLTGCVSTETEMISIKSNEDANQDAVEKTKVDMITTWNTKCGVAEFTRYFIENTMKKVDFTIFPNNTDALIREDEDFVAKRTWEQYNCKFDFLMQELDKSKAEVIHIQYNFGFFSLEKVADLIEFFPNKRIIIDLHATKMISGALEKSTIKKTIGGLNKVYRFIVHQQEDIQELTKMGINDELIQIIPLGQSIWKERKSEECKKWLNISSQHVIGSYGFMLPHKGIGNVIKAVSFLKKEYPDIIYIVSCALYDADVSKQYLLNCINLAKNLNVEKNIVFVNDFLDPEESEIILQACDVLAMVYDPTGESASGAIRFCMSAKRPVLTTKQKIFNEYSDCTLQIERNDSDMVADAIRELFERSKEEYSDKISKKINATSWEVVGEKYLKLYRND